MVIVMLNSHRGSSSSIPWCSQIYSPLFPQNYRVTAMGEGEESRGSVQVASARELGAY